MVPTPSHLPGVNTVTLDGENFPHIAILLSKFHKNEIFHCYVYLTILKQAHYGVCVNISVFY